MSGLVQVSFAPAAGLVGGVPLLETMAGHKTAKKHKNEIEAALGLARDIAKHQTQFPAVLGSENLNMGPVLAVSSSGIGNKDYRAGYAVVKIDASGKIDVPVNQSPFGGTSHLRSSLPATTFPAHDKQWKPVTTHVVVYDP